MLTKHSFNEVYLELLCLLNSKGEANVTRKGEEITSLYDQSFRILSELPLTRSLAACRGYSRTYLLNELNFYLSGSNSLKEAAAISKFWLKCSDDGETINSNYGKLLFYDRNSKGLTQYEHALNCLKNNPQSKKAVMTIYNNENAYISNDNPCTMFLRARIDANTNKLHLSAYMRSSDVYYGLPYDVPFFMLVQYFLAKDLGVEMGHYTHHASDLHKYSSKYGALEDILLGKTAHTEIPEIEHVFDTLYSRFKNLSRQMYMEAAWKASYSAQCLKKQVGACLTKKEGGYENVIETACGGVMGNACTTCVRDSQEDHYYGDECPSVHAEMRCILAAMRKGHTDFSNMTIYVTHGPCDACLKLCAAVGITKVFYDKPYKTNYAHWPTIKVMQLSHQW